MEKTRCCIILPTYKEKLDGYDELSFNKLRNCITLLTSIVYLLKFFKAVSSKGKF